MKKKTNSIFYFWCKDSASRMQSKLALDCWGAVCLSESKVTSVFFRFQEFPTILLKLIWTNTWPLAKSGNLLRKLSRSICHRMSWPFCDTRSWHLVNNNRADILIMPARFSLSLRPRSLERNRSVSHTTCRCNRRQKCRECGYYHLHRHLNDPLFHGLCALMSLWRWARTPRGLSHQRFT